MFDDSLIIFIIIALFAFEMLIRFTSRKKRKVATRGTTEYQLQDDDQLQGFPYKINNRFLTQAELNFFQNLRGVVANRAIVCTKVSLGDVFWVEVQDKSKFRAYRNKIDRKHVDFLLCDLTTMRPLVGIELDDSSHQREDRQTRDAFVDGVFAAAYLPLVHIPVRQGYVNSEIATQIAPYLDISPQPAPSTQTVAAQDAKPVTTSQSPSCPICKNKMVLRKAKSGANAGQPFWGCPNYPTCRGMLAYNGVPAAT